MTFDDYEDDEVFDGSHKGLVDKGEKSIEFVE